MSKPDLTQPWLCKTCGLDNAQIPFAINTMSSTGLAQCILVRYIFLALRNIPGELYILTSISQEN